MADQLAFDLPFRTAMGRADFFVTDANAAAVAGIDSWRDWSLAKMLLVGPEGAGKTHLAHVWAGQSGATVMAASDLTEANLIEFGAAEALVVEDADQIAGNRTAEETLFHLHNALADRAAPLLITARTAPAQWGLTLPDLQSRMQQAGLLTLSPPDDMLLGAVIVKLAQDRQLKLTPQILSHVLPRLDRSMAAAQVFVAEMDAETLAAKQRPGLRHAKTVLARLQG